MNRYFRTSDWRLLRRLCLVAIGTGLPLVSAGQAPAGPNAGSSDRIEEIVVYGRSLKQIGEARSASEGIVGYADIQLPPMLRVGELVEAVPGMVATQHSGTGKANQYFIRGFNLDHGTDFAVSVEGVPINMPTHGHGQGYLDLNFIIPEMVEVARYRRGPYSAQVGDFSSAASVEFDLYDRLDESLVSLTVGEYDYYRGFAAATLAAAGGALTGAVDLTGYDGPWQLSENLDQRKFLLGFMRPLGAASLELKLQGYDSEWDSTDQVPERAVESGAIGQLGFIDPDLGGQTGRYALTAALGHDDWTLMAYAIDYDFTLYSNFTYFLEDPGAGDEFEQRDKRRVYGLELESNAEGQEREFRWGANLRFDDIDEVGLFRTEARIRRDTVRDDTVEELALGAWVEAEFALSDSLRAIAGLRAEYYDWDVSAFRESNSGSGDDTLVSPKASLAWRFADSAEAYLSWGRGFHSNDVRGATISIDPASGDPVEAVDTLVPSEGAELGLRIERERELNVTLTAFWLELDSELVYVGDAGTTEPNDATERLGLEAALFWQLTPWLAANAAYTRTDAEFKLDQGGGREIPGAVESTFTLGLNAVWQSGWQASTRVRWLGEAPLVEDGSVRSDDSLLVNAGIGYRRGAIEYRLDAFNLLDSDDDDIAYFYESRLPGEPGDGVEDIHFHPLEPRSLRASVTVHWN